MATKLSLTFRFPVEKSPKPRKSKSGVPQLNSCKGYGFSKNNSGFRGQLSMKVNAVQDEAIQSSNSETTLLSQTIPPSSSKLVLVVGATGGVGEHFLLFPFIFCSCIILLYLLICSCYL